MNQVALIRSIGHHILPSTLPAFNIVQISYRSIQPSTRTIFIMMLKGEFNLCLVQIVRQFKKKPINNKNSLVFIAVITTYLSLLKNTFVLNLTLHRFNKVSWL